MATGQKLRLWQPNWCEQNNGKNKTKTRVKIVSLAQNRKAHLFIPYHICIAEIEVDTYN